MSALARHRQIVRQRERRGHIVTLLFIVSCVMFRGCKELWAIFGVFSLFVGALALANGI